MILVRLSRILARIEDGLAILVLAFVFILVSYEMINRNVFGQSLPWAEEFSRVLLVVLVYISAIGLSRTDGHVRVELIVNLFGERAHHIATKIADALCLAFSISATWLGIVFVRESISFNLSFAHSNLPFPVWVPQLIVPVGFALISLRLGLRLIGANETDPSGKAV